jgi:hypothetical protein
MLVTDHYFGLPRQIYSAKFIKVGRHIPHWVGPFHRRFMRLRLGLKVFGTERYTTLHHTSGSVSIMITDRATIAETKLLPSSVNRHLTKGILVQ